MLTLVSLVLTAVFLIEIKCTLGTVESEEHEFRVCNGSESVSLRITMPKKVDLENNVTCDCTIEKAESSSGRKMDYTYTGTGAYKLHRVAKKWNDARKICVEEGGHLAIINSKTEEALLINILKKDFEKIRGALVQVQAYLGIHDLYAEGEWVTIFNESLNETGYSEWSPDFYGIQPDNYMDMQNCGTIVTSGGMDDVFCTDKFGFFCEIPLTC